jgi:uncharacterized membrane protein
MRSAEKFVAWILLLGGVLGVSVMVLGIVAAVVQAHGLQAIMHMREPVGGGTGRAADAVSSVGQIARGLRQRPVDPLAVSAVGIVVLFATPVAAVIASGIAFLAEGDRRFAVICALIATALVASFWVGAGG